MTDDPQHQPSLADTLHERIYHRPIDSNADRHTPRDYLERTVIGLAVIAVDNELMSEPRYRTILASLGYASWPELLDLTQRLSESLVITYDEYEPSDDPKDYR